MEVARNKNGKLVMGSHLKRGERYEQILLSYEDWHTRVEKERYVDDKTKPLEPIEWVNYRGFKAKIVDENLFSDKIKRLTWYDEPIILFKEY